jgi:hypothetical protein
MEYLGAKVDATGVWLIERKERAVEVALASHEIAEMDEARQHLITQELGAQPRSLVVVMYENSDDGSGIDARMARAVGLAMADVWPVVMDDHAGTIRRLTR